MDCDWMAHATAATIAVTNLAGLISIALAAHRRAAITAHRDWLDADGADF